MHIYKIYTLTHPITNEIRYVGRTKETLNNRLKTHLRAKDKSHRVNWIKSLQNENLIPNINLICETESFENCIELEQYYIKKYRDLNYRLVNMTDGGDSSIGYKHTDVVKKQLSILTKNRMKDTNVISNLKEKGNKQWEEKTALEKLNNQLNQVTRKNITQYDLDGNLIKIHVSLRQIEKDLGYFRAALSRCLKNECESSYGFIWKYA